MEAENGYLEMINMLDNGNLTNLMAKGKLKLQHPNIKVQLKMDINMVKGFNFLVMETGIMDFMQMAGQKGKEHIIGIMELYIKDNLKMV